MGTADKASNEAQDLKGKVKEAAGKVTGNEELEAEGKSDQAKSALKDVGEKVKDAASKVTHAIKGGKP
ncbi:MAG: CsbD family protein [Frankiaceae bacterium]